MSAIIFDFDGTIVDSFETIIQIFYELTGRHDSLPPDEIERLRGMTLLAAAEELRVQRWRMPFLLMQGRRRMTKRMKEIKLHEDMTETIQKLHAEGHQLFIVSSNSRKNIVEYLEHHNLTVEFVEIYGNAGLLDKAHILKKVLKRNKLDANDAWYIGDEVRDIVGAHHAGVKIMAVTWGFNTAEILNKHNPNQLITTPTEIIRFLEET